MIVKKILSLLTLIFLILFLIVSAIPNDGTDPKPDPDADPWNETGSAPYNDDGNVIIITLGYISTPPYFTFTAQKVNISSAPAVKKVPNSTRSHSRSKVSK
jgi:energy-converting hydrogenase Eha subunit F